MLQDTLLPALRGVLEAIRERRPVHDVVRLVLEQACRLANAAHGSFILVDYETRLLNIAQVSGLDWTPEKKLCRLSIGDGLTGIVAASGKPLVCEDTRLHPGYFPLFEYVRSELVVPVVVKDKVWGLINIDGATPHAFDGTTLQLLAVFAELTSFAITLQLEMNEQEKLHQKLLQSEKLASLGEALAGIAHEINNPLTAILGCASLLQMGCEEPSNGEAIAIIRAETERASGLIKGLLEFSRKETGQRELVDLSTIIRQTVGLKKFQLRASKVQVRVTSDGPCPVMVCPQQIKQVLLNLITNAEQAMRGDRAGPEIHIATACHGAWVSLIVADNGAGIPLEAQKSVFDPFFTTKGPGQGTGLGLSIVHSIVAAHGGNIRLTSSTPEGTTFTLELPLAESDSASHLAPRESESERPPLSGSVLLVDDESHILQTLASFLELLRIDVHRAGDGKGALEILRARPFDVVVSDVRMQGMDGLELYEEARRIDPRYERRFVLMGGYLMSENVREFIAGKGLPCLEKPFSLDAFIRTLEPFLAVPAEVMRARSRLLDAL